MPRKKCFDKTNSVTFKLVHRSQRDPLIADESAPQHVLVEYGSRKKRNQQHHSGDVGDGDEGPSAAKMTTADIEDRKSELRKYGIYYDDDYDYMQHLKAVSDFAVEHDWEPVVNSNRANGSKSSKLLLPSSVFASEYEEEEGMLNKAALPVGPQPDWDPDIVAALDDDFDFDDPDNQIDDDFMKQALGSAEEEGDEASNDAQRGQKRLELNEIGGSNQDQDNGDGEEEDGEWTSEFSSDDDGGNSEHDERQFDEEETKSHFTNYSMTSSVMRRSKGLTLLDERFETLYENEYGDDTEIGALDAEEIEGYMQANSNRMDALIDEFDRSKRNGQYEAEKLKILDMVEQDEQMVTIEIEDSGKNREDRFDCESILSTYSNKYNHPKLIYEPKVKSNNNKLKISASSGIPVGVLGKPKLTAKMLKELDMMDKSESQGVRAADMRSVASAATKLSQLSLRPKDETPQERKARKCELKALRKERRMEKKANQIAFKQEQQRQDQEMRNVRQNLACVRLV